MTSRSLRWSAEASDGRVRIALMGNLNESSGLEELEAQLGQETILDLAGVEHVSSCGARDWIRFLGRAAAGRRKVTLERCSPSVVKQLNMIRNFAGSATVKSVMAPYFCRGCGEEHAEPLALDGTARAPIPEKATCPHCKGASEFDDTEEEYLSFLT